MSKKNSGTLGDAGAIGCGIGCDPMIGTALVILVLGATNIHSCVEEGGREQAFEDLVGEPALILPEITNMTTEELERTLKSLEDSASVERAKKAVLEAFGDDPEVLKKYVQLQDGATQLMQQASIEALEELTGLSIREEALDTALDTAIKRLDAERAATDQGRER